MTIADDLARLEEIVRRLEADDVELDTALALFEEGDLDGVIKNFNPPGSLSSWYDPALVELSIEITAQASNAASRTPTIPKRTNERLRATQHSLVSNLFKLENPDPSGRGRAR